jgi:hypothetical protein
MKGVPQDVVSRGSPDGIEKTYDRLYNGETLTFNLGHTQDHACFDISQGMTLKTKYSFDRKIKTVTDQNYIIDLSGRP